MKTKKISAPILVGTLTGRLPLAAQLRRASQAHVDWLEIRLDTFLSRYDPLSLVRQVRLRWKRPILLTLRSWTEMGPGAAVSASWRLSDQRRRDILMPLLPLVDVIDVEIRRRKFAQIMTARARSKNVQVIHSTHYFKSAGDVRELNRLSLLSRRLRGDYFKVALTPSSNTELQDFLAWGSGLKNKNIALIGMGKIGEISRVLGFCFGSVLTYGHLGAQTAPGQPSAAELRRGLDELYRRR